MQYIPLTEEQKAKVKSYHISTDKNTFDEAILMVGKKVVKRSNRPFKSELKVNTATGVVRNPNTHLWALTFVEDESVVDVKQLRIE